MEKMHKMKVSNRKNKKLAENVHNNVQREQK